MFPKTSKLFFCFAVILIYGCDKNRYFDDYINLDGKWKNSEKINFNFDQKDTINLYNMFITIRNNNDYPFNNLFVIVKLNQPNKEIKVDTLEYQMADVDGTLLGEGITDTKHSKLWYKKNYKFPKSGKYSISIEQANREIGKVNGVEDLEGITEVGFRVEKK